MSTEPGTLIHPQERRAYAAMSAVAYPVWVVLIVATFGVALLFIPLVMLTAWMALRTLRAYLMGHGARVDADHFPHVHQAVQDVANALDYRQPVEVFVIEATVVNAFMAAFLRTRYMVLFSQLLEGVEEDGTALRALIGHELGHLKADHFRKRWLMMPASWLPLLNCCWSRGCEYTADRHAYASSGSLEATEKVLAILAVGWKLARHFKPEQAVKQAREMETSLAAKFNELQSSHPPLVKRIHQLRRFAMPADTQALPTSPGLTFLAGIAAAPGSLGVSASGSQLLPMFVMVAIMASILFPVFARAREKARQASCQSNLKQLGLAVMMYASDYDEQLPIADNWCECLYPYTMNRDIFRCPSHNGTRCGYVFNRHLDRARTVYVNAPAETVVVFDGEGGWNATGDEETVSYRHNGGCNMAFMDGHVKWVPEGAPGVKVKWLPSGG